jgi:hypothetical protein
MGLTRTNSNLSPHSRNPVSRGGAQSHTQGSALLRLADCQGHGLPGRHEGGSWLVKIGSRVEDLFCFAWQIAKGMAYLADMKVGHDW